MFSRDDLKLLLDPDEMVRMILSKVAGHSHILRADGASKLITRDFQLVVQDGVLNFRSGGSTYGMCECSPNLVVRHSMRYFGDEIVRRMLCLSPAELVRALGHWDSIGSWLDSLAVMMADPDPAADLEAEDYLRARLAAARLE